MELLIALSIVLLIYAVLFFFDSFFKSCMHLPYHSFLNGTGITIRLLRLDWYTTALNRIIVNWSTNTSRLFRRTFDLGAYTGILLVPVSSCFLIYTVIGQLFKYYPKSNGSDEIRAVQVEILIPGVTLPTDEIGFYILTILISSLVHELGHAIAAVLEDVPLNGLGIRLLFIVPVAYTDLSTDALERLKNWRKLRILCAGVWHNIIVGLFSYLLFSKLPTFVQPFYNTGTGIIVMDVDRVSSPVYGPKGLKPNDIIVGVNRLKVTNTDTWTEALLETLRDKPRYCVTSDFVHTHDESTKVDNVDGLVECCERGRTENLCFEHFIVNGILEMPPFMCLNIRRMIESSGGYCDDQDNCNPGYYCIKPMLPNRTTIIQVQREDQRTDVLYMGHPRDIYRTIKWSEFIPKYRAVPSQVAESLVTFLKYLTVFSFGLVFVNVLPCYGFDGQYIVRILVNQLLAKFVRRKMKETVSMTISLIGTCLLMLLVFDFFKQHLTRVF